MPPNLFDPAAQQIEQRNYRHYEQTFTINPRQMRGCTLPTKLVWNRVPFKKNKLKGITNRPGVYAFSVLHDTADLPPHGYVLYVGQTGAKTKAQHRTLRQRAREYFREKTTGSREHVALFLNKWAKCLYFYYAQLDPATVDLIDIENKLNDALLPPFSVGDFSPKIRKMKRIARMQ
jgi:hypothetical protein